MSGEGQTPLPFSNGRTNMRLIKYEERFGSKYYMVETEILPEENYNEEMVIQMCHNGPTSVGHLYTEDFDLDLGIDGTVVPEVHNGRVFLNIIIFDSDDLNLDLAPPRKFSAGHGE